MKNCGALLLLLITGIICHGQALEWANAIEGTHYSVFSDDSNNVYITGGYAGTIDIDPGPATLNTTGGGSQLYLLKLDSAGHYLWHQQFPLIGTPPNKFDCVGFAIGGDGSIFMSGTFRGRVDFDPGPGVTSDSSFYEATYLMKLNTQGELDWVKTFNGSYSVFPEDMKMTSNEEIVIIGEFQGTGNFNTSGGTNYITSAGNRDVFVVRMDSTGEIVWAGILGGTSLDYPVGVALDAMDNIYVTGLFYDTADFDPGPDTANLMVPHGLGTFITKLDPTGNYLWSKGFVGDSIPILSPNVRCADIEVDGSDNVIVSGYFYGTVDFDPGTGTSYASANPSAANAFITKLNSSGNYVWNKVIDSPITTNPFATQTDDFDNVYVSGQIMDPGTVDMDPGAGVFNITNSVDGELFLLKLDSLGEFVWVNQFETTGSSFSSRIHINRAGNIIHTGHYDGTIDADPSSGVHLLNPLSGFNDDMFIIKINQDSCSFLSFTFDSLVDVSCAASGYGEVVASGGQPPYDYSWNTSPVTNDSSVVFTTGGYYDITITDGIGCVRNTSVLIGGPSVISGYDLNVNMIPQNEFRPGFSNTICLDAFNAGCTPVSGTLVFVLDSGLTYTGSSIAPATVSGDSLIWNFSNLTYDSTHFAPCVYVTASTALQIGNHLCFDLYINPDGSDTNPANNIKLPCHEIVGSLDPNDKAVYPAGVCQPNYVSKETLTYTIRFQNTGTADAINIFIIDSLDADLDINSVIIVGKSHEPMITELLPGNVLKFRFDDIHLPDSATNEPESHGYVIFEVDPLSSVANGTEITNRVGIYFDFNDPVITNTVFNTIVDSVPSFDYSINLTGNDIVVNAGPSYSYQWFECNTSLIPISGETSNVFSSPTSGNYAVAISNGGCADTSDCMAINVMNIEERIGNTVLVYPNPSENLITVERSLSTSTNLRLFDISGRFVKSIPLVGSKNELDISHLTNGLYIIDVDSFRLRFVKN